MKNVGNLATSCDIFLVRERPSQQPRPFRDTLTHSLDKGPFQSFRSVFCLSLPSRVFIFRLHPKASNRSPEKL